MSQKIIFFLPITLLLTTTALFSNDDPILVTIVKNHHFVEVSMDLEINGAVKLYSALKEDADIKTKKLSPKKEVAFMKWVLHPDRDFYIGVDDEVEMITPRNFKQLSKKYFAATPELVESIGKRGFRYKNLPSMIIYYNKSIAKEGGLTKADIINHQSSK